MRDALQTILNHVETLEAVTRRLADCIGQAACEDIRAELDLPQAPIAGRDGFAVRSEDISAASPQHPVALRVSATARAGHPTRAGVRPGTAVRIMTGSLIPPGADCVVRFEDTDEPAGKNGPAGNPAAVVEIRAAMAPGTHIWPAGSQIRKGQIVLPAGSLIGPAQISALASIGLTRVGVRRAPLVSIIATGDELVRPGAKLGRGRIFCGNSAAVAALVRHYGGVPKVVGIARDREESLRSQIRRALAADAVITIGGVSQGDYDLVRRVTAQMGRVVFSGIPLMPGMAAAFSLIPGSGGAGRQVPVFSLSGPPAGCLVNFETLVRPALLKMLGLSAVEHPTVTATALDGARNERPLALAVFARLRTRAGSCHVRFAILEQKTMQAVMAAANALAILPAQTEVKAGDRIQVLPLDWRRDQLFI